MTSPAPSESKRRAGRAWRLAPVLVWAAAIFAGSSVPGSNVPGGWSVQGHLAEYALLGALALFALTESGPARRVALAALVALVLCSAYGITDEFHQSFVPGRTPDPLDWVADTIGSAAGISATLLWIRWRALRAQ